MPHTFFSFFLFSRRSLRRLLRLLVSLLCVSPLPLFAVYIHNYNFFVAVFCCSVLILLSHFTSVASFGVLFFFQLCFYLSVSLGCLNWSVWGLAGDGTLSQQIEFVAFVCTRNFLFHLCERVEWKWGKKAREENKQKPFNWSEHQQWKWKHTLARQATISTGHE